MPKLFAVIRSRGSRWDEARPLEEQVDWRLHADYMNRLHAAGFVLLGGPLEGTADVLLIVRAESEDAIAARLAEDCWSRNGLLEISRIAPWQLRLGALG
ncbi:MAG: hypothetical protein JOY67_19880 [Hyphomicrobiales bacterium]|nr:hypothetical protein [Hyphomicrobiales bacterium]MBV9115076.1 hypothetical protein [Hyphomicrobiales bacterium]